MKQSVSQTAQSVFADDTQEVNWTPSPAKPQPLAVNNSTKSWVLVEVQRCMRACFINKSLGIFG